MQSRRKTALVLSAGGMFGAYQAGAWEEISARSIEIDFVIGASIGSLNAWAIAGGCPSNELISRWRHLESAGRLRWRVPWPPLRGALDSTHLESEIRDIHHTFQPQVPCGVVLTDLRRLKPALFSGPEVTWRHLAASCAVPGFFPSYTINGRPYSDGGLLNALPLWAAERMGAQRIIAVDAWTPAPWMRWLLRGVRLRSRVVPRIASGLELTKIRPAHQLGSMREALEWNRENTDRWIEMGRRDARRALAG